MACESTPGGTENATPIHSPVPDFPSAARLVIEAGKHASNKGWTPATSGNFSVRASENRIAITRSGVDKGTLASNDILCQPLADPLLAGSSAEAGLHTRLYVDRTDIGAVFHVHSLAASVLGRMHAGSGGIAFEGWELQKALPGVRTHETRVILAVFANSQDIATLADAVARRFAEEPARALLAPGYVIAGHGLYAWGADARQAWRHLEALDALLGCLLAWRG